MDNQKLEIINKLKLIITKIIDFKFENRKFEISNGDELKSNIIGENNTSYDLIKTEDTLSEEEIEDIQEDEEIKDDIVSIETSDFDNSENVVKIEEKTEITENNIEKDENTKTGIIKNIKLAVDKLIELKTDIIYESEEDIDEEIDVAETENDIEEKNIEESVENGNEVEDNTVLKMENNETEDNAEEIVDNDTNVNIDNTDINEETVYEEVETKVETNIDENRIEEKIVYEENEIETEIEPVENTNIEEKGEKKKPKNIDVVFRKYLRNPNSVDIQALSEEERMALITKICEKIDKNRNAMLWIVALFIAAMAGFIYTHKEIPDFIILSICLILVFPFAFWLARIDEYCKIVETINKTDV